MRFTVDDVIWVVVSHDVAKDFAENANRMLFCEGDESKENVIKRFNLSLYLSTYLPTNLRMMIIIILLVG
jgi:hypothetical protein